MAGYFKLQNWALTLPVDSAGLTLGRASEVKILDGFSSAWFYQNSDDTLVFRATVDGATTAGSRYARSELREMDGQTRAAWDLSTGGTMSATLSITEVPKLFNGDAAPVIVGQIHGRSNELVRLYWDDGTVYFKNDQAGPNNSETKFALVDYQGRAPDISVGEEFSYVISVKDNSLLVAVYADGTTYTSETRINAIWQTDSFYFKAGLYLGVNESQATGQGVAEFQALDFAHSLGHGFDGLVGDALSLLRDAASYTSWVAPDTASSAVGIAAVKGTIGDDWLYGTPGSDRFNGLGGSDTLMGGAGDDIYYVDSIDDRIIEYASLGKDKVYSSASYYLPDNVEVLRLTGTSSSSGTGNSLANSIGGNDASNSIRGLGGNDNLYGMGGADIIHGGSGSDKIYGGAGNDILFGGEGSDRFIFDTIPNSATNFDFIKDFSSAQKDRIILSEAIFGDMGDGGKLDAKYFQTGSVASTKTSHILYDVLTGHLYYDADGSGIVEAVRFATVEPFANLSASDFYLL